LKEKRLIKVAKRENFSIAWQIAKVEFLYLKSKIGNDKRKFSSIKKVGIRFA
jgi:hypothetical protein